VGPKKTANIKWLFSEFEAMTKYETRFTKQDFFKPSKNYK